MAKHQLYLWRLTSIANGLNVIRDISVKAQTFIINPSVFVNIRLSEHFFHITVREVLSQT